MHKLKKYAKKNKISKKLIDIFSIGHWIVGFSLFLVAYIIIEKIGLDIHDRYYGALIFVIIAAVIFEFLENYALILLKLNGRDSLKNSLSDIMFNTFGGINAWFIVFLINALI